MMDTKEVMLHSMCYSFWDKKSASGAVKGKNTLNQQLPEELHKPIIIKFKDKNQ